jgi:DNA-binding XRE family transcriptional regulator
MTPSDMETRTQDAEAPEAYSVSMSIAIVKERLSRVTDAEMTDLCRLLPAIVSTDEEERMAAMEAAYEILIPRKGTLSAADFSQADPRSPGMSNWLQFVSQRLKDAREQAGLTQSQLAEKCGLPQSHISRLENGLHSPTSKTLEKISEALGIPASHFDPSSE